MPSGRLVGLALDIQLLFKNHTDIFAGVQRFADEVGWTTVIDNWPEESLASRARRRRIYDGIVARVTTDRMNLVEAAAAAGVPVVNVTCGSPAFSLMHGVFPDYAEIGRIQAEHLLARGARNFAFVGITGRRPDELQRGGFKAAVEAAGHDVSGFDLPESWDDDREVFLNTKARILAWMNAWKRPVGLAGCSDDIIRDIAQLCHQRGWRVPQDVALIGNRNEEHLCEKPRPAISSVEIGFERVGYEAAKLLETLMNERKQKGAKRGGAISAELPHVILPPVGIVARESTDSYATHDPIVAEAQTYIARNCHAFIDVSDVAAAVIVSPKTLQNHFAEAIQATVAQEIRRARVERAKRELAGSNLPIHEVAERSGFTSNARLCEAFRRDVGMSPREYRRLRKVRRGR